MPTAMTNGSRNMPGRAYFANSGGAHHSQALHTFFPSAQGESIGALDLI
jgi:hypothetical protein